MDQNEDSEERLRSALADRYRIEREIGRGGMATVYLAQDLKHDRKVAVKVLDPDLAQNLGAERFLREIRTAANLTHPHILPIHDSGEADGFLFYVMPYAKGDSLRMRLTKEKQLPVEEAIQITREIADALAYAHREGVIHRDVKPANIMVEEGHAVLADFGVAHAVAEAKDERLTRTGTSLGTPAYMSPEQATGEQDLDGRSDQYALGCVLYEMLAGHPPFTGAQVEAVIRQHLMEEPPLVTRVRPSVTEDVVKVINRALSKSPADRFRTTGEMAAALALTTTPVKARSRWGRTKALVYAGTVILGLATAAVIASRRGSGGPELPEDIVVVIPFSNETGDADYDQTGKIVALAIEDRLSQAVPVRVAPSGAVMLSWESALERRAREPAYKPLESVAAEFGAGTVIWGTIYSQSEGLRFQAEIIGGSGARRIRAVDPVIVSLDSARLGIEMVRERVAAALASHLDPALGGILPANEPMPSLSVYRAFARSSEVFFQGDLEECRRLLDLILSEDPTFFTAHTNLAVVHINMGNDREADSILRETEGSFDQMAPLVQAQWTWARATLDGDRETAYRSAKETMERFPAPYGVWTVGFEALRLNRPEEALEVLSNLDSDTPAMERVAGYWEHLSEALHTLGDHKRELREARNGRARHPDNPRVLRAEIRAHAALDNVQEVTDLVEEAILKDAQPTQALRVAALELRAHKHNEAYLTIGERALTYLQSRPAQVTQTRPHRYDLLRALYILERWDDAQGMAEELVREVPENLDYLGYLGTLAARRGEPAEAVRISEELAGIDRPFLRGSNTYWRACIAALLGEKEQAVFLLRQAHEEGVWLDISIHTDMDLEPLRGFPPFEEFMRPKG